MSADTIIIVLLFIPYAIGPWILLLQAQRIAALERQVAELRPRPDPLSTWAETDGSAALSSFENNEDGRI